MNLFTNYKSYEIHKSEFNYSKLILIVDNFDIYNTISFCEIGLTSPFHDFTNK